MIADGLNAVLLSFEPRLRNVRADLNNLTSTKQQGPGLLQCGTDCSNSVATSRSSAGT